MDPPSMTADPDAEAFVTVPDNGEGFLRFEPLVFPIIGPRMDDGKGYPPVPSNDEGAAAATALGSPPPKPVNELA